MANGLFFNNFFMKNRSETKVNASVASNRVQKAFSMNFREQQKLNFKLKLLDHEYIRIRGKLREEIVATKAMQQKLIKSSGWLDASTTAMSTKRRTLRKSKVEPESNKQLSRSVSQAAGGSRYDSTKIREMSQ